MKKLLVLLVLLVVIGGVAFFFGWIQILLPPGSYAVIYTKTGGYEEQPVPAGLFAWRVERLLPTNMTLYIFHVEPKEIETPEIMGTLPSGETYSAVMTGNPDFSYKIRASLLVALQPDKLPALVENEGLRPETLDAWYESKLSTAAQRLAEDLSQNSDSAFDAGYFDGLAERLSRDPVFAGIEIIRITPKELSLPDADLYQEAKRQYFSLAKAREAKDVILIEQEKSNLKVLKEYAELLTEYPILLKYLYLQNLKGNSLDILNLELPSLDKGSE